MSRDEPRSILYEAGAVRQTIESLDEQAAGEAGQFAEVRESERFEYRVRALTVEFTDQAGGWVKHALPSRNLSRFGCAILSGHYVYPKTRCRVHLVSLYNHAQSVPAVVARCRYVRGTGRVYEVGIKFDKPIDIALFHRGASFIRILLVDDDPVVHKMAPKLLNSKNITITSAQSGAEALDLTQNDAFDLILMDLDMPGQGGLAALAELRGRGYCRPVVAVHAKIDADTEKSCYDAGFSRVALKPFSRESLGQLIRSMIAEPLVSALVHDKSMAGLIDVFVRSLPDQVRELEACFTRSDLAATGDLAKQLKASADEHGFDMIGAAADSLDKACATAKERSEVRLLLSDLSRLCFAARPVEVVEQTEPTAPAEKQ